VLGPGLKLLCWRSRGVIFFGNSRDSDKEGREEGSGEVGETFCLLAFLRQDLKGREKTRWRVGLLQRETSQRIIKFMPGYKKNMSVGAGVGRRWNGFKARFLNWGPEPCSAGCSKESECV